jgi:heme A synthase
VALGATLGGLMTQWPYPHACGWHLTGYLGAVTGVLVAGIWIAVVSWRLRNAAAHVLAFLLLLWGVALVAERVLPRVGYAADRATWGCHAPAS